MAVQTPFDLESIVRLDFGALNAAFRHELDYVVRDCRDRPGEKKPRVVTMQFAFTPEPDSVGSVEADNVLVEATILGKIPVRRSKVYSMRPAVASGRHCLLFNPDVPDDPDQPTIFDRLERAEDHLKGAK